MENALKEFQKGNFSSPPDQNMRGFLGSLPWKSGGLPEGQTHESMRAPLRLCP